jgi:hypothetical protein
MAYGIEIVLGWRQDEFNLAMEGLDIRLPQTPADWEEASAMGHHEWIHLHGCERLVEPLRTAHRETLEAAGYPFLGMEVTQIGSPRPVHDTPWGKRVFGVFTPTFYYDPDEMGDREEDAMFGISLSARYRPAFLDAHDPNGTFEHVVFNDDLTKKIEIARSVLTKHLHGFGSARTIVASIHY